MRQTSLFLRSRRNYRCDIQPIGHNDDTTIEFVDGLCRCTDVQCGPVLAERETEKPSDANVIVWGTVEEIVRSESDENINYEMRIRVENAEDTKRGHAGHATFSNK